MSEFIRMFSEAFCLPITTFATGVETMARSMQCGGGGRGWRDGTWFESRDQHAWWNRGQGWGQDGGDWSWDVSWGGCGCGCGCGRCRRGACCRSLGSRAVKLVEWSLVHIARGESAPRGPSGEEREDHHEGGSGVLASGECVVAGDTSLEEFHNQVLVHYGREHEEVEGKNLRVYARVLARFHKPDRDFEGEEIDALHEIRDASSDQESGEES